MSSAGRNGTDASGKRLRLVVLGLSLSSSWGNGHATTYRALLKAFAARGHDVLFLERDVPWYAAHRDLVAPDFCRLALYPDIPALERWRNEIVGADAVVVGSYVPDGIAVGGLVQDWATGVRAFYDIDTPVTLAKLEAGEAEYLNPDLIRGYDLYLSFTGGPTLARIEGEYGSPAARALYCCVDPDLYPALRRPSRWDLSYLGTYSPDRQPGLDALLLEPARRAPHLRFCVAGPQYPDGIEWPANVERISHVPPAEHAGFYAQSRFTLNLTRADMVRAGHSPSVRLFEAAATATPILSDSWAGLETLFLPDREILIAETGNDILAAIGALQEPRRLALGRAARTRVLDGHTASHRAVELETHLRQARRDRDAPSRPLAARPTHPSRA